MTDFPQNFLWGGATAAHQVEGNNINSDLWVMEHLAGGPFAEPSGDACDHYHQYINDISTLKNLGFNSYRFSIEWARVEPEQDFFSKSVLTHYRKMLETCYSLGITPIVTLHHFTSPRWLMRLGGWEGSETPKRFEKYSRVVAESLGDLMPYICIINEANIGAMIRQMTASMMNNVQSQAPVGIGPSDPQSKTVQDARLSWYQNVAKALNTTPEKVKPFLFSTSPAAQRIVMEAHERSREVVKAVNSASQVGLTLAVNDIQAMPGCAAQASEMQNELFESYLPVCSGDDFLGIQNYSRMRIGQDGPLGNEVGVETTQMGYEFYPQALAGVLRMAAGKFPGYLLVTENGIATSDDNRRIAFIQQALEGVQECLREGMDVRGYFYWSLLDNYEWMLGYKPTFGLIAVDRHTQQRTIKNSARYLGAIARSNRIEETRE